MGEVSVKEVVSELLQRVTKLENEESGKFYRYQLITTMDFTCGANNDTEYYVAYCESIKDKIITLESYRIISVNSNGTAELYAEMAEEYNMIVQQTNTFSVNYTFSSGSLVGYLITREKLTSEEILYILDEGNYIIIEEV